MMNKSIFILTGKIHSGKTTALAKWSAGKNAAGIIQPVINGERFFIDLSNGKKIRMTGKEEEEKIKLGEYVFSVSAFSEARKILSKSLELNSEWIIADEFGKLEMIDSGLEPAISELIKRVMKAGDKKLLIVVRDYLLNEFLRKENLSLEEVFVINSPEKLFYI